MLPYLPLLSTLQRERHFCGFGMIFFCARPHFDDARQCGGVSRLALWSAAVQIRRVGTWMGQASSAPPRAGASCLPTSPLLEWRFLPSLVPRSCFPAVVAAAWRGYTCFPDGIVLRYGSQSMAALHLYERLRLGGILFVLETKSKRGSGLEGNARSGWLSPFSALALLSWQLSRCPA